MLDEKVMEVLFCPRSVHTFDLMSQYVFAMIREDYSVSRVLRAFLYRACDGI